MIGKYILDGHTPVKVDDVGEWAADFEERDRTVARTEIGKILVSTVFLGVDHNWSPNGPPLLFETMVFGLPDGNEIQKRYATWDEAEKGHKKIVKQVMKENEITPPLDTQRNS